MKTLCFSAFTECVRQHMNKKSVIKNLDEKQKFALTGRQEIKDASGVFVCYSLMLQALSYRAMISGVDDIPDISKTQTTYLKNGQSDVPVKFVEIAQSEGVVADVSTFFSINLLPNIAKNSLGIVLDAVLDLIEGDNNIGNTTQRKFIAWRKEKAPADFLAEAFVLSVCNGKNKLGFSMEATDDIAITLKNINELKAKLSALPKLEPEQPPAERLFHERVYIDALLDAYDDAVTEGTPPSKDLSHYPKFEKDLKQRRIEYFAAETVRRGTKENFRNKDPDSLFSDLMIQTHSGIYDVHAMDYKDGLARLLGVMAHAGNLNLGNTILGSIPTWVGPSQKKGICHILVNEGQIKGWVDNG